MVLTLKIAFGLLLLVFAISMFGQTYQLITGEPLFSGKSVLQQSKRYFGTKEDGTLYYGYEVYGIKKIKSIFHFFPVLSVNRLKIGNYKYKRYRKAYSFHISEKVKLKLEKTVIEPLEAIEGKEIFPHFYEQVHYSIAFLQEFSKIASEQQLLDEIEKIETLVKEIATFTENIDNKAQKLVHEWNAEQIKNLLDKHNLVMKDNINSVKILNEKNN